MDLTANVPITNPKPPKRSHRVFPPVIRRRARFSFVTGEAMLSDISRDFHVPLDTVKRWAAEGDWYSARKTRLAAMDNYSAYILPPVPGDFLQESLAQAQGKLRKMWKQLDEEDDPVRQEKLANAIWKLSEIEMNLAGRPKPGSLKPTAAKARRTYSGPSLPSLPPPVAQEPPASEPQVSCPVSSEPVNETETGAGI